MPTYRKEIIQSKVVRTNNVFFHMEPWDRREHLRRMHVYVVSESGEKAFAGVTSSDDDAEKVSHRRVRPASSSWPAAFSAAGILALLRTANQSVQVKKFLRPRLITRTVVGNRAPLFQYAPPSQQRVQPAITP